MSNRGVMVAVNGDGSFVYICNEFTDESLQQQLVAVFLGRGREYLANEETLQQFPSEDDLFAFLRQQPVTLDTQDDNEGRMRCFTLSRYLFYSFRAALERSVDDARTGEEV